MSVGQTYTSAVSVLLQKKTIFVSFVVIAKDAVNTA